MSGNPYGELKRAGERPVSTIRYRLGMSGNPYGELKLDGRSVLQKPRNLGMSGNPYGELKRMYNIFQSSYNYARHVGESLRGIET